MEQSIIDFFWPGLLWHNSTEKLTVGSSGITAKLCATLQIQRVLANACAQLQIQNM